LGNGEKVSVWNYPWLRNENQAYITTPMIEGREDMKVSELIDHDIGKWNITLIQHFFNPWDVAEILKIPLNLLHKEDEQIWKLSRQGLYSVGQLTITSLRLYSTTII
jgi:hypothetical protein